MKKIGLLLVTLILLLSFGLPSTASTFTDVKNYTEEINYLTSKGIIKGYEDGTFKPENPIKRIQAVQMILREKGITDFTAPDPNFIDMKPGDYGYSEVAKAVSMGFISGKTDSKGLKYFDPYGTLTRAQMAKILVIAYDLEGVYNKDFLDVPKGNWAYEFVSSLAANNITTGYQDGSFKPNTKLSRQHFAVFMARNLDDKFKPLPELEAHFIDVGQGDSSLIITPSGKTILIDGGKKTAGEKVVSYLKQAGVTSIDLLVATHPDADHIGGLINVLEQIPVKKVLDSGKEHTTETYLEYLSLIDSKNIPFEVPITGQALDIDSSIKVQVLNSGDQNSSDNNENSIVLKLTYGSVSFLLTGDASIEIEEDMISKFDVKSTILKAGHHGANTSTSQAFVNAVKSEVTILSYGQDNAYGHPTDEVVSRLKANGSKLYSTAESGDIVIQTNGKSYNVSAKPWDAPVTPPEIIPEPEPIPEPKPTPTPIPADVAIISKDLSKETVGIKNNGSVDIDMTGWYLISVEGNQRYDFPSGYVLKSGATVNITSGKDAKDQPPTHLKWTTANIWNNSGDAAELFNPEGEKVSEYR